MCLNRVPVSTSCPATVTLLFSQIKALPYAQQASLLDLLHELLYSPFHVLFISGPKL